MEVLLTGGTGLIGRALAQRLAAEGHGLTVLSRDPQRATRRLGTGVRIWRDLAEWKDPQRLDAIVNLAGEPIVDRRWTDGQKARIRSSRIGVTESLIDRLMAASARPRVLISGSAIGYYGEAGDRELSEADPPGSGFAAELCADWEATALRARGLRVCRLRTGLVLAREGGMLARMRPAFRLGLGARIGNGQQWMSWIHLDDVVELVLRMLDDEALEGPFNLCAPGAVRNSEFTQSLARAVKRPACLAAPSPWLRLAMGERAELLLASQKVRPRRALEAGFRFAHPELAPALRHLIESRA